MGNWIDAAAILREVTQGREKFRETIRFGEVSFGPIGVKVLIGDPSGDVFKLLDVDSTKDSRASNIHLDQSVYRWDSWQGYVEVDEEIVWDEKTTFGSLPASKSRGKGQVTYEEEWEEVAREEGRKGEGWYIPVSKGRRSFKRGHEQCETTQRNV